MGIKTQVHAEEGKQFLIVTREFDLPVSLLFKAHAEPEIIEQWMGTQVKKFEARKFGGWEFETKDPKGNVAFRANGVFHEFVTDKKITRTFEMENAPFDVQLEFLEFESLDNGKSNLTMYQIYRSTELRDQLLKMPFAQGINMAHNRLQEIVSNLK